MSDFSGVFWVALFCVMLVVLGTAISIALPYVLAIVVPGFGGYVAFVKWRDNPRRLEAEKAALHRELYEKVTAGSLASYDDDEINRRLHYHLPGNLPTSVADDLVYVGRRILDSIDLTTVVPPPPVVANSIEGARWRDKVASASIRSPEYVKEAIDTVAQLLGFMASFVPRTDGSVRLPITSFMPNLRDTIEEVIVTLAGNDAFKALETILEKNIAEAGDVPPTEYKGTDPIEAYLKRTPLQQLFTLTVPFALPQELRTQHHQIIANSGHGKTQCIQSMILDDWQTDAAVVVIDSQGDLINNLLAHAPLDRVVLIDPETCPPALNIFDMKVKGEYELATAIELFEYVFSALDSGLTGKQSLVYRYLSRLLMEIPGATIETMRDLLKAGGSEPYQQYIDRLGPNAKAFFDEYQKEKANQYNETRQEVLRRLLMVLESDTFSRMLSAPNMAFDFSELLDSSKIILISTSKRLLKGGSSLFGRIFIALLMQAIMTRQKHRRRTYLYIDEFADYAEDSQVLFNLFEQARKYELGMVVCHQYLDQLPLQLRKSISANTAIKFAGGVSAEDARALASQMQTTPEAITAQPKLSFSAWLKGTGAITWQVEYGRLERTPRHAEYELDHFRDDMREQYGVKVRVAEPPPRPEEPEEETDRW